MRKLLFLVVLSIFGAVQVKADPACASGQSLAYWATNYATAAQACSIGGLDVWGFSDTGTSVPSSSGPSAIPAFNATTIEITPVTTGGDGVLISGFGGLALESVGVTGVQDLEFPFLVKCDNGTTCLSSVAMTIIGSSTGGAAGGQDVLTETYCGGGTYVPPTAPCVNPGGIPVQDKLSINPGVVYPGCPASSNCETDNFSAVSILSMNKDFGAYSGLQGVSGGSGGGTATIISVEDLFSPTGTPPPVPEPSAILMLGSGLLGLALLSVRRRRQGII